MNTTDKQELQARDATPEFAAEIYEQEEVNARRGKFIFWLVVGMFLAAFVCLGATKLWTN